MKQAAFLIIVILFIFSSNHKAQKASVICPNIRINSSVDESSLVGAYKGMRMPEDAVCPGTVVIFTAEIAGLDSKTKPSFKWKVTAGKIISGQGTSTLKVQTRDEAVEATVDVTGLPKEYKSCPVQLSKRVFVAICDVFVCPLCISASITAPDSVISSARDFVAVARINYPDFEERLTYEWTITDGIILEGQGTLAIKANCLGLENCTVEFKIKGMPPECPSNVKRLIDVWANTSPRKVDSYGHLTLDDEKPHLDLLATELKQKESAQGYIVVYGNSKEITEDITKRLNETRFYLTGDLKISVDRVKVIYGGYKESPITELWITPPGITPPLQASK